MKKIVVYIALFLVQTIILAQNNTIDSLKKVLKTEKTDSARVIILCFLGQEYEQFRPDTAMLYAQQAYKISTKIKYADGIARAANGIGNVYRLIGNYPKALEYFIQKLKIEEQRNNPNKLAIVLMNIAGVYHMEQEEEKALEYQMKADSIIDAARMDDLKIYSLLNLGDMYEKSGKLQAALLSTEKAYTIALKEKDVSLTGSILNNLGNIYAKLGDTLRAVKQYQSALPYLEQTQNEDVMAETTLGLAKQYLLLSVSDSAAFYGVKSYEICKKNGFLSRQLTASIFLKDYYKDKGDVKNAFAYQEEILTLKDSIFSKERIAKAQAISLEEDLRQKEMAEKKLEEEHERKVKLQYLTIGILLPILFFLTLYLSNKKIKPKIIEFLGVVSLLLSFEYIMLLLHPVIVTVTNHEPIYQLLIFALIASVLTPAHHRIEKWLLKKLTLKEKISVINFRIQ
ncbi:MAG: tetratricopeptide repeat protein [Chitinophagales bacterium]